MDRPPVLDTEVLLEHAGWVRAVAHSLLEDQDSAEDLAQDTMLVALERRPVDVDSVSGWLGGVLRHLAARTHRGDARRQRREGRAARAGEVPSAGELAERAVTLREVVQAVIELEEPYRSTVMLRYFEDMTPSTIARRLGIPAATVRTRLHRAHALLRQKLAQRFGRIDARARLLAVALAPSGWIAATLGSGPAASILAKGMVAAGALLAVGLVWSWSRRDHASPPPVLQAAAADALPAPPAPVAPVAADGSEAQRLDVPAPEPEPAPAPPAVAHLHVRVEWEGTGQPVAGVPLSLSWTALRDSDVQQSSGVTGADGMWDVELAAPARVHTLWAATTAATPGAFAMESIGLETGASEDMVLSLPRPGMVEGTVLDADGQPMAGAEVLGWMSMMRPDWPADHADRSTTSDENGHFCLEGLADDFWLVARAGALLPAHSVSGHLDSGCDLAGVQLHVEATRTLAGRVRTARGEAVAGAKVEVVAHDLDEGQGEATEDAHWRARGTPAFTVSSGADGQFSLAVPASAAVRVSVRGQSLRLGPDESWAEVVLEDGASLAGRVLDRAGRPVPGARVQVFPHARSMVGWPPSARTDGTGSFACHLREAVDNVSIAVRREGYAPTFLPSVPLDPAGAPVVIYLDLGKAVAGTVLDAAGAPVAFARLRLEELDPAQDGMPGGPFGGMDGMFDPNGKSTDEAGRFRIDGLRAGMYRLWVTPLSAKHPEALALAEAGSEDLRVVLGDGMEQLISVRGVVLDAATGAPVPAFSVFVESESAWGGFEKFEDGSGRFDLPAQDPERLRGVTVRAEGYADWHLDLAAQCPCHLDVRLAAERSLRVRVLGPTGEPLADAGLAVRDGAGQPVRLRSPFGSGFGFGFGSGRGGRVSTDAQGEALLDGLPAGPVTVLVSAEDDAPAEEYTLDLSTPVEEVQELHLPATGQ